MTFRLASRSCTDNSPEYHVSHVLSHLHVGKERFKLISVNSSVWKIFLKTSQHLIKLSLVKSSVLTELHFKRPSLPLVIDHPLPVLHGQSGLPQQLRRYIERIVLYLGSSEVGIFIKFSVQRYLPTAHTASEASRCQLEILVQAETTCQPLIALLYCYYKSGIYVIFQDWSESPYFGGVFTTLHHLRLI